MLDSQCGLLLPRGEARGGIRDHLPYAGNLVDWVQEML